MANIGLSQHRILVTTLVLNIFIGFPGFQFLSVVGADEGVVVCEEGKLRCADGTQCYSVMDKCDNLRHCTDGSDESDCELHCSAGDIPCRPDNMCIPSMFRCDNTEDCPDGSDEKNCTSNGDQVSHNCFDSEFQCANGECINELLHCDGKPQCTDESDETGCPNSQGGDVGIGCADSADFDCKGDGSECIKYEYLCDQHPDCSGGQDENNSTCADYKVPGMVDTPSRTRQTNLSLCDAINPCAHYCDPVDGRQVCSCKDGYHLADDKNSCLVNGDEPELIYANHSQLISYGLRTGNKATYTINTIVQSIAYDHINHKIFYIDHNRKSINWIPKDFSSEPVTLIDKYIHEPVSLAYDWIHDTLYWADVTPSTGFANSRIEAVKLSTMDRTTVLSAQHVRDPRQLAVDPRPNKGYLYWAQIGTSPRICRSGLDGSNPECFITTDVLQPSGLTIDFLTSTLYWIDKHLGQIVSYNLETLQRHMVTDKIEYPRHPTSLDVFEDTLYWADDRTNTLYRWRLITSDSSALPQKVFENLESTKDAVIYHPQRFPQGENYCGSYNGGCSHICLPSPHYRKFTCACPNVVKAKNGTVTYALDSTGKTCVEKKVLLPTTTAATTRAMTRPSGEETKESSSELNNESGNNEKQQHGKKEEEGSGGGMMIGIIAGIVVALIVLIVVVIVVVWKVRANKRENQMQFANPSFETKPLNGQAMKNGQNGQNGHGMRTSPA